MEKILIGYDYGTGGLWAYVLAPSVAAVRERFRTKHADRLPQLVVFDTPPSFWNERIERLTKTYASLSMN